MRLLVTGGCGFIGSNYIRYSLKHHRNYKILNVDKLTYAGNLENLEDLEKKKNYQFIRGDITNARIMGKIFRKFRPDAVINFAAETHVDRSILTPSPFIKTNFLGVGVLLNLALKFSVQKFIQISTDEVYGSILKGRFTENSPMNPSSPYSASKAGADHLALSYYKTYRLPVLVTRSSNNYGPYQFPEKLIPLVIINALDNKKIPVYGDGLNVRDWLYVEDNCEAIDLIFQKGQPGQIYNIGAKQEMANIDVIKKILKILDRDFSLISFVKDRPGHDRRYALSIKRIMQDIGWKPSTTFNQGIEKTINWYLRHKRWLRNIKQGSYRRFYKKHYTKLGLKQI